MEEEFNLEQMPVSAEEQAPKKKRGRKPKAQVAEAQEPLPVSEAPKKKRGRKPKSEIAKEQAVPDTPMLEGFADESSATKPLSDRDIEPVVTDSPIPHSDAPDNYDEDEEFEKYNRRNREREINKRNDEFSYTASSDYEESEEDSEDIPTSFKTSDEDLIEDSYRYRDFDEEPDSPADADSSPESEPSQGSESDSLSDSQEAQSDAGQQRYQFERNQSRNRNQNNRNQRQQNNRNQQQNRGGNQNRNQPNQNRNRNVQNRNNNQNRQQQPRQQNKWLKLGDRRVDEAFDPSSYLEWEALKTKEGIEALANSISGDTRVIDYTSYWGLSQRDLQQKLMQDGVEFDKFSGINGMFESLLKQLAKDGGALRVSGILDVFDGNQGGAICFACDSYRLKKFNVYVPQKVIDENGLLRGCEVSGLALPPRPESKDKCPVLVKVESVMSMTPEQARALTPFNELTPYYPTRRIILEADANAGWDNLSMRVVDLLTPLGLGQRALIVAPPRTGKTVLMQGMAKAIRRNVPDAHVIVLMVDERPEEVTDFKRTVDAEIIASTFDEDAFSHVHAAEMVISKARRMVEAGKDVVILLDSITRLARAYNTLMPNSGKIMSGGVEANALQKPKRFFGSARNIEGGGSLTIIGTALIETGSKMDEVIFEEFKGTGNLELHLDRSLVDKRIFPAINIEKSGTRKEELLYHPDEMAKIYSLRRAMKGVPSAESMELLIQRLKKVKTNVEFLMGINR